MAKFEVPPPTLSLDAAKEAAAYIFAKARRGNEEAVLALERLHEVTEGVRGIVSGKPLDVGSSLLAVLEAAIIALFRHALKVKEQGAVLPLVDEIDAMWSRLEGGHVGADEDSVGADQK